MKSSKTDSKTLSVGNIAGGRFLNSPGYSILALYMPLTVIAALVFLVKAFLPLPSIFLIINACVSALTAFIFCDLRKAGRTGHAASTIRSGIAAMVVSYILSSVFCREAGSAERFLPSLPNILASLETFYVWISVVSLKQLFSARERFEAYTTLHQGEQLKKALEKDFGLQQYSGDEITRIRNFYLFQLIVIGFIIFFTVFSRITLPLPVYILLIVILVSGICICGFFGIMRREQYHAGEGIVLSAFDRIKHILAMGILSVLAIAGAVVLSSNKSLFPFSAISGFFSRLFGMFYHSEETQTAAPVELEPLVSSSDGMENTAVWPVRHLLRYGFIVFVMAGFILLLILSRSSRNRVFRKEVPVHQGVGSTIIQWFKGLLLALGSFFGFFGKDKTPLAPNKPSAGQIRRTSEAILGAYSQAKKNDMLQSVTLFARLIIWGGEVRHILWKPAHGPGEYCGLLAASVPPQTALNEGIIRCGELFEQALYSTEVLSDAERNEFRDLVEEITGGS